MNKSELIDAIAAKTGLSKTDVGGVLDGFAEVAYGAVGSGDKITIPGFLSIEQTYRSARTGRNPQTGATIQIAATNAAKVSAGSKLKAAAKG
ncbi:MAG TPA: HU family DNA-binding protein [Acidimicrobiales bacterium]|jgi:DNA-binding protein HU-beta